MKLLMDEIEQFLTAGDGRSESGSLSGLYRPASAVEIAAAKARPAGMEETQQ